MFYAMPETVLSNCKNILFNNELWEFRRKEKNEKCNGDREDNIATKLIALLKCIIFATLQRDKIA